MSSFRGRAGYKCASFAVDSTARRSLEWYPNRLVYAVGSPDSGTLSLLAKSVLLGPGRGRRGPAYRGSIDGEVRHRANDTAIRSAVPRRR
jgi:hypothetical protein